MPLKSVSFTDYAQIQPSSYSVCWNSTEVVHIVKAKKTITLNQL